MRYSIALLATITVIFFGHALWQIQQRNALPNIQIDGGEVYDGGTVAVGSSLVHTFRIKNPHPFALNLEVPSAGCTCTTATVSASHIPAHGTADVILHVEPENGKFSGSASIVTTHAGKSAETWLIVTGKSTAAKTQTIKAQVVENR